MILNIHHHSLWGVPLYGFFYFLGSFIALALAFWVIRRQPLYRHIAYFDLIGLTWLAGVLGAKGLALWMMPQPFSEILQTWGWANLFEGGYHLFGGIVLAGGVFVLAVWFWKLPVWKSIHLLLLTALPGLALGRLGCLFAGCCFGKEAQDFPLLVQYDPQVYTTLLAQGTRFPVQVMNAGVSWLLSGIVWMRTLRSAWGMTTFQQVGPGVAIIFMVFGGARFGEEFYRDPLSRTDVSALGGLFFNQWAALFLGICGVIVGGLWMWRNYAVRSQDLVKS